MKNEVLSNIKARHSKRSFLDRSVSKEIVEDVLLTAGHAPSSKNTQPWKVAVLQGASKIKLADALCKKFDAKEIETSDYRDMIDPIPDEFRDRARQCGFSLFDLKGIKREDKEKRRLHDRENFVFFNAPLYLLFHLPRGAERGNFLDMGFFMQNVMLGFQSFGISSCPQYSVVSFPDTIREVLSIENDRVMVSGLAVGYADTKEKVNTFIPPRLNLKAYVEWYH